MKMNHRELSQLQILMSDWSETGRIDLGDWGPHEVFLVLAGQPDLREKFLALLECRLGEPIH
jgi:hypothetical protein